MEKQKRKNSGSSNKYQRMALIITGLILAVPSVLFVFPFGGLVIAFCANRQIEIIGLLIAFSAPFGGFASAFFVSGRLKTYPDFQHYVEMTVATLVGSIAYVLVSIFIGWYLFSLAPVEMCIG